MNALARHIQPVMQMFILSHYLFDFGIGFIDILRIAGQRHPAKRPDATAEQRTNIGWHKSRKIKGVFHPISFAI